ncbi:geranylgeranyl pyrophosphate synthase [Sulfolobales archaeon HS-7]|nr:geranylgeranyl pyrophosphate synthase [Sulfolobales archaeon HS-7]
MKRLENISMESYINNVIGHVDNTIIEKLTPGLQDEYERNLYEAATHLFKAGGKRLRPVITYMITDMLGGDTNRAILAGAGIEMLHVFTLIHDDIMDRDELRRGVKSVHAEYGINNAILAGDLLHALGMRTILEAVRGLNEQIIYESIRLIHDSIIIIAEGQAIDMGFENSPIVAEDRYFKMIEKKTAQLFGAAMGLGALISGQDTKIVDMTIRAGINTGIAFQIVDDILGLTGDETEIGKPKFSDLREGKKTILIIKAFEDADRNEKEFITRVLGNKEVSQSELEKAVNIILRYSLDYARQKASEYIKQAKILIDQLPEKNPLPRKYISQVLDLTIERRK